MGRQRPVGPLPITPQEMGSLPEWAAWKLLFMGPTREALSRMGLRGKPTAELSWAATQKEWQEFRQGMRETNPLRDVARPSVERGAALLNRLPGMQALNRFFGFPAEGTPAVAAESDQPRAATGPRAEVENLIKTVVGEDFKKGQDLQYIMNETISLHQAGDPVAAAEYLQKQGAPGYTIVPLMRMARKSAFSGAPIADDSPLGIVDYADSYAALAMLARARSARLGPAGELGGLYGP